MMRRGWRVRGGGLSLRHGRVRIVTTAPGGSVVYDSGWRPNVTTVYAAATVAGWMTGRNNTGYNPAPPPNMMELGTGSGTPSDTDTGLFAPVAATLQQVSTMGQENGSPQTAQWVCQYYGTANNAGTYTEVGLFDTHGNMWGHLMESITLTSGLSTTITWQKPCSTS